MRPAEDVARRLLDAQEKIAPAFAEFPPGRRELGTLEAAIAWLIQERVIVLPTPTSTKAHPRAVSEVGRDLDTIREMLGTIREQYAWIHSFAHAPMSSSGLEGRSNASGAVTVDEVDYEDPKRIDYSDPTGVAVSDHRKHLARDLLEDASRAVEDARASLSSIEGRFGKHYDPRWSDQVAANDREKRGEVGPKLVGSKDEVAEHERRRDERESAAEPDEDGWTTAGSTGAFGG